MADNSRIEWCSATWNPTTGCTKVSPGCDHCYAEGIFNRFNGPGAFDTVQLRPERLTLPLSWRKPRRVFVNSMSDLFHDDVPDEFIAQVFAVMALTSRHTYQVLTKRHGRLRSLLNDEDFQLMVAEYASGVMGDEPPHLHRLDVRGGSDGWRVIGKDLFGGNIWAPTWPLPNVWLGVSVEDQKWANIRIPALLDTPASVRFLSCEPLLGPVDVCFSQCREHDFPGGMCTFSCPDRQRIHWVIVGGESGHGARAMDCEWAERIRDDCEASNTAFFFKQAGAVLAREWGCTDRKGHNPAEWPEAFPREFPAELVLA